MYVCDQILLLRYLHKHMAFLKYFITWMGVVVVTEIISHASNNNHIEGKLIFAVVVTAAAVVVVNHNQENKMFPYFLFLLYQYLVSTFFTFF